MHHGDACRCPTVTTQHVTDLLVDLVNGTSATCDPLAYPGGTGGPGYQPTVAEVEEIGDLWTPEQLAEESPQLAIDRRFIAVPTPDGPMFPMAQARRQRMPDGTIYAYVPPQIRGFLSPLMQDPWRAFVLLTTPSDVLDGWSPWEFCRDTRVDIEFMAELAYSLRVL